MIPRKRLVLLVALLTPVLVVVLSGIIVYNHFRPIGPFYFQTEGIEAPLTEATAIKKAQEALRLALGEVDLWAIQPPLKSRLRSELGDRFFERNRNDVSDGQFCFVNRQNGSLVFVQVTLRDSEIQCWVVPAK